MKSFVSLLRLVVHSLMGLLILMQELEPLLHQLVGFPNRSQLLQLNT